MTRLPAPVHAVPLDAAGRHVPSSSCPCRPLQARDLLEPARVVVVHRHAPGLAAAADEVRRVVGKPW